MELRKVSLRGLEAAIDECAEGQEEASRRRDATLAGLQQIRYVFVYPEQKDIVLVGPAEGWKVDASGNVVGVTTGRPVMLLDDLLVALRTARHAAQGGITCSIDPTPEGLQQSAAYARTLKHDRRSATRSASIEQALGLQQITFTGVPATSHFARVLVAADYRMKRMAMNFEPSPVRGAAELPAHDRQPQRHEQHAAAVVAGAEVRGAAARRRRPGLGAARRQREGHDRGGLLPRPAASASTPARPIPWRRSGPTT